MDKKVKERMFKYIERNGMTLYQKYFINIENINEALQKPLENIWISIAKANIRLLAINKCIENFVLSGNCYQINAQEKGKIILYYGKIIELGKFLDNFHDKIIEIFEI